MRHAFECNIWIWNNEKKQRVLKTLVQTKRFTRPNESLLYTRSLLIQKLFEQLAIHFFLTLLKNIWTFLKTISLCTILFKNYVIVIIIIAAMMAQSLQPTSQRIDGVQTQNLIISKPTTQLDYSKYVKKFSSSLECGSSYCKDLNYR